MAASKVAVAARTTNLLHIVLDGPRHIVMDHRLNITLVDTHAEGDGAAEHAHFVVDELLLSKVPLLIRLAGVVGGCSDTVLIQVAGYVVRCAPLRRE